MKIKEIVPKINGIQEALKTPLSNLELPSHTFQETLADQGDFDLMDGLTLNSEGELLLELDVADHEDAVKHADYSIFTGRDPDGDGVAYEVIPKVPDTFWVRLAVKGEGQTKLTTSLDAVGLGAKVFAEAGVTVFLPGKSEETLGNVLTTAASSFVTEKPFTPLDALPVGGGMEVAFNGQVGLEAKLDLTDALVSAVGWIAEQGAHFIGFTPVSTKAGVGVSLTLSGGFLFQMGRLPDEQERVCYRFRLATQSQSDIGVSLRAKTVVDVDVDPLLDGLEARLMEILGLTGDGLFKRLQNRPEEVFTHLRLNPTTFDVKVKAQEWLDELQGKVKERMTAQLVADAEFALNRSTSRETLSQWKSMIPKEENQWDASVKEALMELDTQALYEKITKFRGGRCVAETFFVQESKTQSVRLGAGLQLGSWQVAARNSRSFTFRKTNNLLVEGSTTAAFEFSRSRARAIAFETDAWDVSLDSSPVVSATPGNRNQFDHQHYNLSCSWQTDLKGETFRKLKPEDAGEFVDLYCLILRGILPKGLEQVPLTVRLANCLRDAGWIGEKGHAALEVSFEKYSAAEMKDLSEAVCAFLDDEEKLRHACVSAIPWDDTPHRHSLDVRVELYPWLIQRLFRKDYSLQNGGRLVTNLANQHKGSHSEGIKEELEASKRVKRPTEKFSFVKYKKVEESLLAVVHDFEKTREALEDTKRGFTTLKQAIEQHQVIEPKQTKALLKHLFALPGTGNVYDFRLFVYILTEVAVKPFDLKAEVVSDEKKSVMTLYSS